ncbi:MAG: metallophosphoesterase [Thermoplasmata archaeon]|nr:metallophosphoesterase [Thermoplasmata archaeon]
MRIMAVGDVHGEEHLAAVQASLAGGPEADLILLAGDISHRNDVDLYGRVLEAFQEASEAPIVAVFGNHDYADSHAAYRMAYPITFLEEETKDLQVAGRRVRVIGSTGVLDRPTWWQRTNLPQIAAEYTRRLHVLDGLLEEEGFRILLTHYAPTYRTLVGEGESYWDQLGSKRMESVLLRHRPELVIHGHAHLGVPYAELQTGQTTLTTFDRGRTIPVHNVAFPVRKELTLLEL